MTMDDNNSKRLVREFVESAITEMMIDEETEELNEFSTTRDIAGYTLPLGMVPPRRPETDARGRLVKRKKKKKRKGGNPLFPGNTSW